MREEDVIVPSYLIASVILLAITVLLAAIVTIYVFPISSSTSSSGPNTVFTIEEETITVNGEPEVKITFGYNVGDSIAADELKVTVNSNQAYSLDTDTETEGDHAIRKSPDLTTRFSESNTFNVIGYANETKSNTDSPTTVEDITTLERGDMIRVIWTNSESDTEQTLREYTVPSNIS